MPAWLPLLMLTLPGIMFAACAVNATVFPSATRPWSTIPAIGLVLALLPAHLLALAFGSLTAGLAVAWIAVGSAGVTWATRHRLDLHILVKANQTDWLQLAVAGLATLPIVAPTILRNFHDEQLLGGHLAMIAHLQNGAYPPRYLYEPSLPLRYHYGFDLAGAILTGILRVRPDHAIDILTLMLWPCMFLLLWRLGSHIGGQRAGPFVAFSTCFAGTWPLFCSVDNNGSLLSKLTWRLIGQCSIDGMTINPPFISYFFQHPWSLGVPIFALAVLQRAAIRQGGNKSVGLAVLACSLALLSLCEVVLFVTTVAAFGVTELWLLFLRHDRRAIPVLVVLALSFPFAKLMGGFLASGAYPPAEGVFGTAFFFRDFSSFGTVLQQLLWIVSSFGAILILGLIGLVRLDRERLFLGALAAIGLAVSSLFKYQFTWDAVKFATVASIAFAMASGVVLAQIWDWAREPVRKVAFGIVVVALTWQGIAFPFLALVFFRAQQSIITPYFSLSFPIDRDEARAIAYLRTHMGPFDMVFRNRSKIFAYATLAGLPYPGSYYAEMNGTNDQYGLGKAKLSRRRDLDRVSDDWIARLSVEHVQWIVSDSGEKEMNATLENALADHAVSTAAQFGEIRISRINSRP